ncbi:MAG: Xaa-Pro peptidase family protein [Melioribacteraceae bacterium]|nr:Xaa-Pro peptidase family protein [Melioribacteraceae bacterium]MCF8356560.1 Xaa-Pro peptidase family protein [Melioribacteraceae bacterium]MCF8395920.1 Xaa-Pro peptidase family protein [Melioribacteraceae bacterium]MCF8421010.1 Xaa-Pro peptidase family protein [Melioribacteraceae bacterium]
MKKELILEKQQQAAQILNELDIDMWMTFVRETGNIKDPMLDMIAGTGATWHSAFIITRDGDTTAIIGSLEEPNMKMVGTFKNIISYLKSVKDDLIKTLDKYNPNKIAINFSRDSSLADGLTHGVYLELIELLKDTPYAERFVSSENIVAALRGRKSAAELSIMKEAIKETLIIFDEVTKYLQPGITEKEVAVFVHNIAEEKGFGLAWDKEYCPSVFTGPDTAGAHAGPTDRKIQKGHVINMDFGIKLNGYCSDLQRTWYVLKDGEDTPPDEVMRGFNVIKDSIQIAAKTIKPGAVAWTVDDAARSYIVENGYEEYPHGLGHQVGRAAHDGGALLGPKWERYGNLPYLTLEESQVFTIEPRLTIKDYGIATIEEEVVITKDGCEFLSPNQKEIYLIK